MVEAFDVVILAGGTGERLGGVSKADLLLGGRRLLDHLLADLAALRAAGAPLGSIVVVAPDSVTVPDGVVRTLEDPPGGGPAAGIAAGLAVLDGSGLVAVLACDAPRSARALPVLLRALADGGAGIDGAVVRNAAGFDQYLLGVYRAEGLRLRAGEETGARDISARRFFAPLRLVPVEAGDLDRDVDTWADLAAMEGASPEARHVATEGAC